jgi:hypothetical protein
VVDNCTPSGRIMPLQVVAAFFIWLLMLLSPEALFYLFIDQLAHKSK